MIHPDHGLLGLLYNRTDKLTSLFIRVLSSILFGMCIFFYCSYQIIMPEDQKKPGTMA